MPSASPPSERGRPGDGLGRRPSAPAVGVALIAILAVVADLVIGLTRPHLARVVTVLLLLANALVIAVLGTAALLAVRAADRRRSRLRAARHTELAAREDADRLLKAVDNTSSVIYMRDEDGRYLLVNRRYEELFNVNRDTIVGMTDHDLFPREMADAFRANDLKALAKAAPIQMEEIAPHADGPHTYITVKYPVTDLAGRPYAVCGISTDITDLKRAEEEVRRLNTDLEIRIRQRTAELEASIRELDAFVHSVAHDLRAPVRVVAGLSEILAADYAERLEDQGGDFLRRVRSASERIEKLLDGLLEMSDAARAEPNREPVDLGRIAAEIAAGLADAEPRRDVAVGIEDGLVVAADAGLAEMVLRNLLTNAWAFTATVPEARVDIGSAERDGVRAFYVRDNGAGFDVRDTDGLSFPLDLPSGDFARGSGIRLAIAARIVTRHGGRTWAESEPGHGSTFFFTLAPVPQAEPDNTGW